MNDLARLATLIALEGRRESLARRHTCLICWNTGESPVNRIEDNGTCCLVRTWTRRFLLTCSHVWNGFENFRSAHAGAQLWISSIADDLPLAPSFPLQVANPRLIAKEDGLDLATIDFDGINSIEAMRFFHFKPNPKPTARKGDIVHFLGYAGDAVREGKLNFVLNYCYSSQTIHDVGRIQFILHSEPGTMHHEDKNGTTIPPFRAGGESGAPVFKVRENLELELAGIVSKLCSSGLGSGESTPYEMSDGDVFITHACFVQDDGSLTAP